MPSEKKAFALRIHPALFAALARLAAQDLRSVNSEIEFLLREALLRRGIRADDDSEETSEQGGK